MSVMSVEPVEGGEAARVDRVSLLRGAIYARFSSRFQHSIKDQFRACLEWARCNGIAVGRRHFFRDKAVSGRHARRRAFERLIAALAAGEVDVVIVFSTSRLFRKMYKALQFVEEVIVEKNRRCVFVQNNIDTADTER
jgi:DNA invertase Pin-like site-specific DNA recombinase